MLFVVAAVRLCSGITGITLDKVDDVKCVHAQLADVLCRSSSSGSSSKHNSTNSNGSSGDGTVDGTSAAASISSLAPALTLGDTILAHLAANNVDISGCEACKHQCDVSRPKEAAEFWYQPSKNKLGNRKTRNQRRIDNQKQMRHHQNQV